MRNGIVDLELGGLRPRSPMSPEGRTEIALELTSASLVIGPLVYGRSGESPWLWLVIIGGGVGLYVWSRVRGWPQARRWSDVGDRLFLIGAPWWVQALFLAIIGGGSLYHLASGHYRWYWWFLPAIAWLAFAEVVVTRKGAGGGE